MKKIFFFLCFGFLTNSYAQLNNSITLSGGVVQKDSYGFLINYNYSSNNSNYEVGVVHSIFNKSINSDIDATFSNTSLQLGYLHSVLRSRDNAISINLGLGLFGGYENIPKNEDLVVVSESGPIYGMYAAGQLDFYTSDNFAFVLRAQQNYVLQSSTGSYNPYFGFGLKFNF